MLCMDMAANARKRSPLTAALAAQLRAERAAAGLTQADLAKASGISRVQLARIEGGERTLDVAQAADIAKALGLTLVEFVQRAEERLDAEVRLAMSAAAKRPKASGG